MPWTATKAPTLGHAHANIPGEDAYVQALEVRWAALGRLWRASSGPDDQPKAGTAALDRVSASDLAAAGATAYRWGWQAALAALPLEKARRAAESVTLDPIEIALGIDFAVTNPEAVAWLRRYGFELIRQMSEEEIEAIRRAMVEAYVEQRPWYETARIIAETVPLTNLQQDRWWKFYETERRLRPKTADVRAGRYAKRLARQRAILIARTETTRASTEGQQALWDQAAANGWIDPARTVQRWSAAKGSERTCAICGRLHGQTTHLGGEFELDGRHWTGPPAHPNCRCAVVLDFEPMRRPRRTITFRKR